MAKSDFRFSTPLRVRWMECDAQGIAFYGAYMGYLEVGQSEYYRNLGFSVYKVAQRGYFDTAVVKATLEYKAPARVDDVVQVYARMSRVGSTSITMECEVYREGEDELLLNAEVVYVSYEARQGTKKPVPPAIRQLIAHFEETGEVLPLSRFSDLALAAQEPTGDSG